MARSGDARAANGSATGRWWMVLAVATALVLVESFLPDPWDDVARVTGLVLGATVATVGVARNRPVARRAWLAMLIGTWLGALDQVLWRLATGHDLVSSAPDVLVPSLVAGAGYAAVFTALLLLATAGQRTLRRRALLVDTAIVAVAAGFVAVTLVAGFVEDPARPAAMWAGVVFCVLVVAVAFSALPVVRSRVGRPSTWFVGASVGFVVLASGAFAVEQADPSRAPFWPVFLGLSVVTGGAAMLHPSMRAVGTEARRVEAPLDARQLAVGGLALLVPAVVVGVADLVASSPPASPLVLAAYLVGMAVLLRARTRLLVTEGRRSDERFRQYFSLPLIGMCITAPDGRAVDLNERLCQMLGRSRDELLGTRLGDVVDPDDMARDLVELTRLARGELTSVVSERRYLRPDGGVVYTRCTDHVVTDEDGNVEYILSLIDDITEAHAADERMAAHLALQDVVLSVAERFVNIEATDVDHAVDDALARLGTECHADLAFLFELREGRADTRHLWRVGERHDQAGDARIRAIVDQTFADPATLQLLLASGAATTDRPAELAAEHPEAVRMMKVAGVKGAAVLPLLADDVLMGAIGLVRQTSSEPWSQETVDLLRLAAEVFAQALLRRRTAAALAESEERNRSVVEAAADGIVTVDHHGLIRTFNPAAEALTGWMAAEVVGRSADLLVPTDSRQLIAEFLEEHADDGAGEKTEIDGLRRDGTRVPLELTVSAVELPDGRGVTVIARDVSDRKRLEAQLTHQALHDPLTGLANRTLLLDRVGQALRRSQRTGSYPIVLFIDLDRFKVINDSLGHHVGDELLVVIARRLAAELRAGDTAARLGGDEFVALCEGLDTFEQAEALADRILAAVCHPVELARATPVLTASIGIVRADASSTPETLLRDADASMYRAKELGRNRTHHFDESVHGDAIERLQLEAGLRQAIGRGELRLHLQPQYGTADLCPVGAEALLRWDHPETGLLAPDRFLGVAEEIGLDVEIDRWVLGEGCRHAVRCRAENPDFVVWVNLSARVLADPTLPRLVFDALADAGLPPDGLGIEVTERALVRDIDLAAASLDELRRAGVGIAIDDFGTGFSSLSWLERLPLDVLKIDRSFISGLGTSHDDTVIVRSVIAMAHSLGLAALAEGVETLPQLLRLRELGCDQFQGYLAARPVPVAEVHPTEAARLSPLAAAP